MERGTVPLLRSI